VDSLVSVEEDAPLLLKGEPYFPLAGEDLAEGGANVAYVGQSRRLAEGCEYILIDNQRIYDRKKIMAKPHREYALSFRRSRATYPAMDRVWAWNR
jgi:hypothetical protein